MKNRIHKIKYLDLLLPLAGGSLANLAFAPYRIAWFAILATAALYASLRTATPKQALLRGWCFGMGLFGFGLSWLHIVMHDHGAMPLTFAWLLAALAISALSLLFAAQAYVLARFARLDTHWGSFVTFPLSWVVFEWIRATLFTGFPWLLLGVSQTDGPLGNYLPLIGIGGTSFMVAVCGVALWLCMQQIGTITKARWLAILTLLGLHHLIPALPLWGLIAFFIYNILFLRNKSTWGFTVLIGIYLTAGLLQFNHYTTPDKTLTVSMVQVNVPNRMKWDINEIANTISKYFILSKQAWQSDVVIWPEGAIPRLKQDLPELLDDLTQTAKAADATLILGLPSYNAEDWVYHNSLYALGVDDGQYHKRHLVPFGEYVPLQQWIRGIFSFLDLPMSVLSPGNSQQQPMPVRDTLFAPFICFETAYSEYLARALPQATVLLALSDDSWFGQSNAAQQHLQIGQALAAMGGRPLLHSTNTGVTAIVNERGRVVKALPEHQQGVLTGQVQAYTGFTPWAWLNQFPMWAWLANIVFIFICWQSGRREGWSKVRIKWGMPRDSSLRSE